MPGANEVLRCPRKYFSANPFYRLSNFRTIRSLDAPPVLHHAPVTTFFSSFFAIYLHFVYKSWPLGCPPGWMPGAVAPSAPPSARHWPCMATRLGYKSLLGGNRTFVFCNNYTNELSLYLS